MLFVEIAVLETKREDVRVGAKVFRCLSSWLTANAVPQENIIGTPLVAALFQVMVGTGRLGTG